VLGLGIGVACNGDKSQGFTEMNVPCGHQGNFVTCTTALHGLQLVCIATTPTRVTQACH